MDIKMTNTVKAFAHELGADLAGIANIERFTAAPVKMSPQGIMPSARSVVVCAIHHPDACIQLGGEEHPQIQGPYRIQGAMNNKLDYMAFRIARLLEEKGFKAVPIASSNIWRYREYEGLDAVFAPDISHIYAAVAAGLGEPGWSGITLTPEYGPWNRFISIITDAELVPTPLYSGPELCDMCGECIRHCPADAFRKEVKGVKTIKIEDKTYEFANKNLWRCAWGEHFNLDLDLDIPDVVDEEVILETVKKHGMRSGEFGQCLKFCLPPHLRGGRAGFTSTYIRKKHCEASGLPAHRGMIDRIIEIADRYHLDNIGFTGTETLMKSGLDPAQWLPGGKSVISLCVEINIPEGEKSGNELMANTTRNANWSRNVAAEEYPADSLVNLYSSSARNLLDFAALDMAGELERLGYKVVTKTDMPADKAAVAAGIYAGKTEGGAVRLYDTVITEALLPDEKHAGLQSFAANEHGTIKFSELKRHLGSLNADTAGFMTSAVSDSIVDQISPVKEGEEILKVWDKNIRFSSYDPIVKKDARRLLKTSDYIRGAKNVIIAGMHYPHASVETAGKPPAEAVGQYVFAQYEVRRQLSYLAHSAVKFLNSYGYKAMYTFDLMGIGTQVVTPRGYLANSAANALAAAAAGLGELTYNGMVYNPEHGINQVFVAIITDAQIKNDIACSDQSGKSCCGAKDAAIAVGDEKSVSVSEYCASCGKCIKACPAAAIPSDKGIDIKIEVNGKTKNIKYIPIDTKRCDWSCKYALCGDDGFKYVGSRIDEKPSEEITEESIAAAVAKSDPVLKFRGVTAEKCIVECPMASRDFRFPVR